MTLAPLAGALNRMIDKKTKDAICKAGNDLSIALTGFYGKVVLNYNNGVFSVANVEQSVKDSCVKTK